MKPSVLRRLENDEVFRVQVAKIAKDYLKLGRDSLEYWSRDFDYSYDLMLGYAPLTRTDYERLERGDPRRFILPMTSTQVVTMTTYISQVLFGQETPHKVEGRGPEDELPAEYMNQLLRWNSEQQATYLLGYLWVQDALVCNRAIFYNTWAPIYRTRVRASQEEDKAAEPMFNSETGEYDYPKYEKLEKEKVTTGHYARMDLVSPYDFVCDPGLPLWRFQEMRFAGHRTQIPWVELERRSQLPEDDPYHVFPWAVEAIREKKQKKGTETSPDIVATGAPTGGIEANIRVSRTGYERGRSVNPTGNDTADKEDIGNIECYEMWIKLIPHNYELGDEKDVRLLQFLVAQGDILCALNESPYEHDDLPYSVAEGRPFAHFQFSPSWVSIMKGIQDHVDWLKNRHQEALSRTVGNIFIYDPSKVDVDDFMNPEKEGLLIALRPEAQGSPIRDVIQQVPIKDMTERFHEEMMQFAQFSESVTAANSAMQGSVSGKSDTATEYAGTQQMAAGRLTSIARLLSVQGLVPQTKQFVANFQQFMDQEMIVRFSSGDINLNPYLRGARSLKLNRDVIQGEFDFIAHDGTLPGTDTKKVAAITRVLEAGAAFPDIFMPAEGNLNPRNLIFAAAKASGLNVESFFYDSRQFAAGVGGAPPGAPPMGGAPAPGMPMTPGPTPATPSLPPTPDAATLPALAAVQPRPQTI
jgi:hypothetical protein